MSPNRFGRRVNSHRIDRFLRQSGTAESPGKKQTEERKIKARETEVAESIKVIMKALRDYFGLKSGSPRERLRVIGSEFGHMVSRNISSSDQVEKVLEEVSFFWTTHGLGEMEIVKGELLTFTMRDCYDCIGPQAGETLRGFKEGFITAFLNEKSPALGSVEKIECCGTGAENCKFALVGFT